MLAITMKFHITSKSKTKVPQASVNICPCGGKIHAVTEYALLTSLSSHLTSLSSRDDKLVLAADWLVRFTSEASSGELGFFGCTLAGKRTGAVNADMKRFHIVLDRVS